MPKAVTVPNHGVPAVRSQTSLLIDRGLAFAEPASVAALFIYLLSETWLKWGDPLIDFPRDLYLAWRISQGALLYRDVANWYGPLSNLVQGAGFRIFGVGLDTMLWMNIGVAVINLLLLRAIFREVGGRYLAWVASIVFIAVFAFGNYALVSNYNFITPYCSQTIYSFLGLLLVLWGWMSHLKSGRSAWLGVAGLGLAVAYLDKPEATLAAVGALVVYLAAQWIKIRHSNHRLTFLWTWLVWLAGGFLILWLPVFAYFLAHSNGAFAWRAVNAVPYSLIDENIRDAALNLGFFKLLAGLDSPWANLIFSLKASGILCLICGTMIAACHKWGRAERGTFAWWGWLLLAVAPLLPCIWEIPELGFWDLSAKAVVIPVCSATLISIWWSFRAAWREDASFPRALSLAVIGVAASLMMARIILNARYPHYGFYLMPLALTYWIHVIAVEFPRHTGAQERSRLLLRLVFTPVVLLACAVLLGDSLDYYEAKTFEVGSGHDRFYTFPSDIYINGWELKTMLEGYRSIKPSSNSLVVFPEGIAVNYHLRIVSPLREMEFQPLALAYAGPDNVLRELQADPPSVIFLHSRDLGEFGTPYFGADNASGRKIALWIKDNYAPFGYAGVSNNNITGHAVDFLVLKKQPIQ